MKANFSFTENCSRKKKKKIPEKAERRFHLYANTRPCTGKSHDMGMWSVRLPAAP